MRFIGIGIFTISLTCAIPISSIYADQADLILDLRGPGQELGFGNVGPAGDFNGDGFGDFVVGSGTKAYVYYGSSVPDSIPDLVLPFPQGAVEAHSISGGGDVNHDGFADIVIGSPLPEENVRVFLGGSSPSDQAAVTLTSLEDPWEVLQFGASVSATRDLDGDGFADIIVGAPWYDHPQDGGLGPGRAYVYSGATLNSSLPITLDPLPGPSIFLGGPGFGLNTDAADIDGDGRGEVLVYQRGMMEPCAGRAYFFTQTANGFVPHLLPAEPFPLGSPIASVGDLDGDGKEEVAVTLSTIRIQPNGCSGGLPELVYLYSGARLTEGDLTPLLVLSGRDVPCAPCTAQGERYYGTSIAGGRDVNGDGAPDLVVGDAYGNAYVYFGRAKLDATPDIALHGGVSFGRYVALQDVTGDGLAEVLVGAPGIGHVYVYRANPPLPARAFVHGGVRSVPVGNARERLLIQVEPVNGSYQNEDVDLASLRLGASGSATSIMPLQDKGMVDEDSDHNGVPELRVTFDAGALARLLPGAGRRAVSLRMTGDTYQGKTFRADFEITMVGHPLLMASETAVRPNPLNPSGTISFGPRANGTSTIRVYDVSGRLRRTMTHLIVNAPAPQEVLFDGCDDRGRTLSSGVYMYRIDLPGGALKGRFIVAR